jgi:hypothetical protein
MSMRRLTPLRLFGLLALLLLPAALVGGGSPGSALAEARLGAQTQPTSNQDGTLALHVYFRDNAERDRLATELGAEEHSTTNGYLVVLGDQALRDSLVARGLRVEIDQKLTDKLQRMGDPAYYDTFYGGYRTVEEIYAFLDAKVAAHPTLVQKVDVGDSWCKTHLGACTQPNSWSGFDLYVLRISNQAIPGPKPVFWYDAGIHSREIATPEVAMRFIDHLLNGYNTDADARWLVDWHDIWVMPTLNPDGHHMNESNGEGQPTFHRKNADRDDGCTTYDQFGTDINRNFSFMWGCCGGSSGNACSETYRGPAQNSEEETLAVVNTVRSLIPDQRGPNENDLAPITTTGTLINMHSNAQQNLYPWGYTSSFAPNRTDLRNIGRHMSSAQVIPPGNGYEYCQNTECLYIVDGDEKNWAYGELGIPAYSLELSGDDFFPEYACLDAGGPPCTHSVGPGIWPQNRGALLYHAKIVRQPYLLTRGPDTNSRPTQPIVVEQGVTANLTATLNYVWNGSDAQPNAYLQNVAAAEYYIDTPPWAGGTGVAMTATDGAFDEPNEPAGAGIPTGSLSVGRHVVFIRGRGVNDYSGFQSWGPVTAVFLDVIPVGGPTPTSIVSTPTPTTAPPTNTATRTATNPPAATNTPTNTAVATNTTAPTQTPGGNTATPEPSNTNTSTPEATSTPGEPTATPTSCLIQFTDVPEGHTFYDFIRCLACRGVIGGYPCGGDGEPCDQDNNPYFRPGNLVTRGQLAKIVAISAGYNDPVSGQTFEDVQPGTAFYTYTEQLAGDGVMGGYPCGQVEGEPCIPPDNRPYFRPGNSATRGQLTKIVALAAGFNDPAPSTFTFTDVPEGHTFHIYVEALLTNRPGVMEGYPCGGPGEPCDDESRPYFRPNNSLTRGQASKIVANTFFPECVTPAKR